MLRPHERALRCSFPLSSAPEGLTQRMCEGSVWHSLTHTHTHTHTHTLGLSKYLGICGEKFIYYILFVIAVNFHSYTFSCCIVAHCTLYCIYLFYLFCLILHVSVHLLFLSIYRSMFFFVSPSISNLSVYLCAPRYVFTFPSRVRIFLVVYSLQQLLRYWNSAIIHFLF